MLRLRAAAMPLSAAERQASADFYGFLGERLAGRRTSAPAGRGAFVLRRWPSGARAAATPDAAQMRGCATGAASQGLFGLGTAVALALGAWLFRAGALTIGAVYPDLPLHRDAAPTDRADPQRVPGLAAGGRQRRPHRDLLGRRRARIDDGAGRPLPAGRWRSSSTASRSATSATTPVLRDLTCAWRRGARARRARAHRQRQDDADAPALPRSTIPTAGAVRLGGVDLRDGRRWPRCAGASAW